MQRSTVAALGVAAGLALAGPLATAEAETPCQAPMRVGLARTSSPAAGSPTEVKPTVALSSSGPAEAMNMGGLRGTGTTDIAIAASPALPASVSSEEITVDIPKRFARTGPGLTTQYLPEPEFSKPRILQHGTLIAFTLCVDARHIDAGSYVGQVIVGGPVGVQPATVAVTLNAKDEGKFILGMVLAGIVAVLLLLFRGIKIHMEKLPEGTTKNLRNALLPTVTDFVGFVAPTVVAVAAALVALLQVYDSNVSWGADSISSLIALGGTAISAAGLGTFLSSLKGA